MIAKFNIKNIKLLFIIGTALFFFPSQLMAARVTGEDAPVPTIVSSPPRTEVPSSSGKRQGKKETMPPAPQTGEKTGIPEQPEPKPVDVRSLPVAEGQTTGVKQEAETVPSSKTAVLTEVQPTSPAEAKKHFKDTKYVTIDFDNVDIQIFVKFISELTGKNFVIDDKVKGKVTVISPRKISIDEVYKVFESVLEVYGFATVTTGDVIKVVPALEARGKNLETLSDKKGVIPEDRIVTQIISLEHANPDEVKKILEPLISGTSIVLSYPPTGMLVITDFLSNIKKVTEIVGALDVEGVAAQIFYLPLKAASAAEIVKSLSLLFQQQPQRSAFAPVRLVADERANAIILVASETDTGRIKKLIDLMDKEVPKGESMLRVYRLQNAVAEDMARVLMNIPRDAKDFAQKGKSPLLSRDVQVMADKATNTLIITAGKDDYRVLEDVIRSLDVSRPMVYIEALVMEVGVTKNFKVGVEWRGLKETGSISELGVKGGAAFIGSGGLGTSGEYDIIPDVTTSTEGGALKFPRGFSLGFLGTGINIGGVMFPNIGAVIRAYQTDSDVSILSTPQIMTMDNEEAEITVGKNVPYVTRLDTTNTGSNINYSNYEYKDVGMTLNITPHINEENFVRLKLNQKVTKVIMEESPTGLPTTMKREAKTTVVIKDNETIVIGGLLGDSTEAGTYRVPCLGSIPILGWLFKSTSREREKTNLYVFITPHIIRTQKDAAAVYKDKKAGIGEVVEGVIKLNGKMTPKAPAVKEAPSVQDGK